MHFELKTELCIGVVVHQSIDEPPIRYCVDSFTANKEKKIFGRIVSPGVALSLISTGRIEVEFVAF